MFFHDIEKWIKIKNKYPKDMWTYLAILRNFYEIRGKCLKKDNYLDVVNNPII